MKNAEKFWNIIWFIMSIIMVFCASTLLAFSGNYLSKETYTVHDIITHYEEGEPTVTVETQVTEIPLQKNLDIPGLFDLSSPDTLILFDISGSMRESVTSFYTENLEFFQSGHDIWYFNTDIQKGADINTITFGGDTNVIMAINTASLAGYKNILVFSDMEQTVKKARLDVSDDSNLSVYILSPSEITDHSVIEQLKDCTGIESLKLLEIG